MKVTTLGQLLLLILVTFSAQYVVVIGSSSSVHGNETDRLSLLGFKDAISLDPQQALMSWNDSTHFCDWEGVVCRVKAPPRVTSLNLTGRGLVGHISPSLGNLTFLQSLALTENTLAGEIPCIIPWSHASPRNLALEQKHAARKDTEFYKLLKAQGVGCFG